MSKRDLFRIIFRIYAVYSLIIGLLYIVPQNLSNIAFEMQTGIGGFAIYALLLSLLFVIGFTILLIRKADTLINWFKLDKGYDTDDVNLTQFNTEFIFTMASVIIGGFLIIDYTPTLIMQTINAFSETQGSANLEGEFKMQWGMNVIRIFVGYLLIKFAPKMHLLVTRKKENPKDPDSTAE